MVVVVAVFACGGWVGLVWGLGNGRWGSTWRGAIPLLYTPHRCLLVLLDRPVSLPPVALLTHGCNVLPTPFADEAIDSGVKVAVCSTSNERAVSNIVKARSTTTPPLCHHTPRTSPGPCAASVPWHFAQEELAAVRRSWPPFSGPPRWFPCCLTCARPARLNNLCASWPPCNAGHAGGPHCLPHARVCGRLRAQEEARPRHLQPGGAGAWPPAPAWHGGAGRCVCVCVSHKVDHLPSDQSFSSFASSMCVCACVLLAGVVRAGLRRQRLSRAPSPCLA